MRIQEPYPIFEKIKNENQTIEEDEILELVMEKNQKMEDDEGFLHLSVVVRLYFLVQDGSQKMMKAAWKFDEHRWPMVNG